MLMVQDVDMTPNPQALKFILNERLLNVETRSFQSKEEAQQDPLAKGVFEIEGVESVFYMDKFVTIEKHPEVGWGVIQKGLLNLLKNFDKSQIPPEEGVPEMTSEEESQILKQIKSILDERVRPALAGDGGGLEVMGLDGNILKIKYQGACGTCPSAIRGTLLAIENLLKREVDPNIQVESA